MAFAKFEGNRLRIDGEIAENHAILVNLTASLKTIPGLKVVYLHIYQVNCIHLEEYHSSHYPEEVLLAQFSLYMHKGCLNPPSFHFI